jgi:hypothetical protein
LVVVFLAFGSLKASKEPDKWNLVPVAGFEFVEFVDLLLLVIFGIKGVPRRLNGVPFGIICRVDSHVPG